MIGTALILGGLMPAAIAAPALAAPTELFISEYIEGTSNNKALEIFNGTGATVNLQTGGYNVQMHFNGNPVAGLTINLTGTVANGDVYVLAQASAVASILAQADQTNSAGWFNGDDAVVLRKGTTVIDLIGQTGFDPGTEWGTGLASTADNTLRRKSSIQAGDPDGTNEFDPAAQWDGFATDTFDGLGAHAVDGDDVAPTVTSTSPANGATGISPAASINVTFSEAVNASATSFSLVCAPSGSHSLTVSGGPTTYTVNPDTDFTTADNCTLTVIAANVTDQDSADPPDQMAANHAVSFTTIQACGATATPIHDVQGAGTASPIVGTRVEVEGIVVADLQGGGGFSGYYLQEEDADADSNPASSEGVFVFNTSVAVAPGQRVRVAGAVAEFNGETQISSVTGALVCASGLSVARTPVELPFETLTYPERWEGMLVELGQDLVIAEYFNYERFGEIVLALPIGDEVRPFTPTAVVEPGGPAQARAALNLRSRITLDDGLNAQNPNNVRHPNGGNFSLANRFRGGDTVSDTVGVLGFGFNVYRIQPTASATYTSVNPRPAEPEDVGGTLRAAAMNTLNFFLTADAIQDDSGDNNPADDVCGGNANLECRGFDTGQPLEFDRQRDKLLAAIAGLDADVVGLNELENTPGVEPLRDPTRGLVAGLNAMPGVGPYAAIDTGVIGTDAIRVGLLYRPDRVTPIGSYQILDSTVDSRFIDSRSRPVLAQTFEEVATGARFTVAVNHLKSKGSACTGAPLNDPDAGDGQGNCNQTRKLAAQALVDWLQTDPTASGDRDYLILGDINSYAKEDPIDAILAGADDSPGTLDDYTNLIAKYQGAYAHSYVFDGQAGYLDHALASATLVGQVTGAADWHINSDEPDLLDYDTSFKPAAQESIYEPNAYRSSDHDPVVVGLNLLDYEFDGFQDPLVNPPLVNRTNAGASVPLKFELSGDLGPDVVYGTPTVTQFSCTLGSGSEMGAATTAGRSLLEYDALTNTYTYVWKTDKKQHLDTCQTFELTLDDGTFRQALFSFAK